MWIRSQSKLMLAKINMVFINFNEQTEILGSVNVDTEGVPLGEYATKERTLEVLDDIHQYVNGIHKIYEMPKD